MNFEKLGNIKLYNCDCMDYMATCKDNEFDLAIVDPPYKRGFIENGQIGNSKFVKKDWDKKIPSKKYFVELKRISKNQIIWGANYFKYLWPNHSFIFWNKHNHDNKSDGELAYTSFNIGNRYFSYLWDGNRYGFINKQIKGVGKKTIRIHPTQKPIKLYEWLLLNYAKPGQKIFDSHFGSLSIGIACHNLGFELTACELDKDYYEDAKKRLQIHQMQKTIFDVIK